MALTQDHDTESPLCYRCVTDDFLSRKIETEGIEDDCSFCEFYGQTLSLGKIADLVDVAFNEHFERTSVEPSGWEYAMMRETDYDWDREGEQVHYVVSEIAGVDENIAEAIVSILSEKHGDWDSAVMGEETEFDADSHYVPKTCSDCSYHQSRWHDFERRLETECRFIGKSSQETLDDVFEGIGEFTTRDAESVVHFVGPNTKTPILFRARVFQSHAGLERGLARPDLEIGSPPLGKAKPGRMNAHGISVFYGALNPETALAEVRPPVGSDVVIGKFEILRQLRVINLAALRKILIRKSYFDPNCRLLQERAEFLGRLSIRMTRPVMPEREQNDYLVTQVIADYLASEHRLDGMVFPSVQVDKGVNIVLFHSASRVEELDIPEGTKFNVRPDGWSDDGPDPNFLVTEIRPVPTTPKVVSELKDEHDLIGLITMDFPNLPDLDRRKHSLRILTDDVEIRTVKSVKFTTDDASVRREHKNKD